MEKGYKMYLESITKELDNKNYLKIQPSSLSLLKDYPNNH